MVRFHAYIFGGPFQSDSTHRSEALFGQILRKSIWRPFSVRFNAQIRDPFWLDSTHNIISRPFSVRFNALIRGPFWSDSTHIYLEALFSQIQRIDQRPFLVRLYANVFGGPFQSDSTHRSEALLGQILLINIWRPFSVRFNA